MARKILANDYSLPNGYERISLENIRAALGDFEYLSSHYTQVIDKNRKVVPAEFNDAQRYFYKLIWPMVAPETRLDRHRDVVVVKGRQMRFTTTMVGLVNYICAYASGIKNMSVIHTLPVVDSALRLGVTKVEPLLTGVHPDIQPDITKQSLGSSIVYTFDNVSGVRRNNRYEITSCSTKSIRSTTNHIALFDEFGYYKNPQDIEDIVNGSLPDTGFSLSVYFSTYGGERYGDHFTNKIKMAMDNPDSMDLIFIPWFLGYPEAPLGATMEDLGGLSEYEKNVIIPELRRYSIPEPQWADKILWYRRRSTGVRMKLEFPTTLSEVVEAGATNRLWSDDAIEFQRSNVETGTPYELLLDPITKQTKAVETEASAFTIYRQPVYGRKYITVVDPIMSQSDGSDFFAMSIFDVDNLEQVATYRDRDMPVEDAAAICAAASKLYCNSLICPERNVAEAFNVCVRALGYYYFWYEDKKAKAKRLPGLRTTATTKLAYLDKLSLLLEQKKLKLHNSVWVDELCTFERKVKTRSDGSQTVKYMARKGKADDTVSVLWIFAGTLSQRQLEGRKRIGFAFM